jgi:hypothetical protein
LTGEDTGLPQLLQICVTYSPDCEKIRPLADALCSLTGAFTACGLAPKPVAAEETKKAAKAGSSAASSAPPVPGLPQLPGATSPTGIVPNLSKQISDLVKGALGGGAR